MSAFVTATDLSRWADGRPSQSQLPLLIRRLIAAAVNPIRIDFPAGDSVNRPGFDGFLQTADGTAFVPAGQSVWELGTGQKPAEKAEQDYTSRTTDPSGIDPARTTFVFVTPRRWQDKAGWANDKRGEGRWADVRAYDADDLEQWLDESRAVAAWARRLIGGVPDGVSDVEEVWDLWALRTRPGLTPQVFLAGRAPAAEAVRAWLDGPARCLRVRSASAEEAVGFLAAAVEALPEADRERVRARAVLVSAPDAWRAAVGQRTPLILLAASAALGSDAQAVARGHHAFLAYGNDSAGVAVDIDLPPLRRPPLEAALEGIGLPAERAREVAGASRGRVAALVDLLGGGGVAPPWAAPAVAPSLAPILLAGAWTQAEGDVEALLRLTRTGGDGLSALLSRWVNDTDPPLRLVGGVWEWVARPRAWPHLARHLTAADIAAFRGVVVDVLGETDPRYDLPPSDRWMAGALGRTRRYSDHLRDGLAEGLALLASRPESVRLHADPAGLARGVVRELFGSQPSAARWFSLAPVLRTLAEAAPDEFLAAVERDAVGDEAVREGLFQEEGVFGGSRHADLLWALETLAWCPELLSRAAVALAGLAARDLGGRTANRPSASLRAIFLPERPQTTASVAHRLSAIDAVYRRHPDVAFALAADVTGRTHGFVTETPRPRWLECQVDPERSVSMGEYRGAVEGLFDRLLGWAGHDDRRWARFMSTLPTVGAERVSAMLDRLEALPLEAMAARSESELRAALRSLLHRWRTVEGVYPQLSVEDAGRAEAAYSRLEPADLIERHAWLFANRPELLTVTGDDWRHEQEALGAAREAAVADILAAGGPEALLRLVPRAEAAFAVGCYAGRAGVPDGDVARLISAGMTGDPSLRDFLRGVVGGGFGRDGWGWVRRVIASDAFRSWSADGAAQFALALPFASPTWDLADSLGEGVAAAYWAGAGGYWLADPQADAVRAVRTFLERGRPFAAFELTDACMHAHQVALAPELLLAVLRAITAAATGEQEAADAPREGRGIGWHLGELLVAVEDAGVADETELARVEWVWLQALEHTRRGIRTLDRVLTRDPMFFAQAVALVYRPRLPSGEPAPTPPADGTTRRRAEMAWRLLQEWDGVPGRSADGSIDPVALRAWVTGARKALRDSGHARVGDQNVGQVLARLPAGADGVWPHEHLRGVLEELAAEDVETGVYLGVVNGRGITSRRPDEGGEQEWQLAERYDGWAAAVAAGFPRTARVLREIATRYREHARREDAERDLDEYRW